MKVSRRMTRMICGVFFFAAFCVFAVDVFAEGPAELDPIKTEAQEKFLAEKAKADENAKDTATVKDVADSGVRFRVKELRIYGNTLLSTEYLLADIPEIYNSSRKPIAEADSSEIFDFQVLQYVIAEPGQAYEISVRTIQGFSQYLLSVYQKHHYAGINISLPEDAIENGELKDGILSIKVTEIPVGEVTVSSFDVEHNATEEGYLRKDLIEEWSPVTSGEVINEKKLDDFINLLNLNPDRYVSVTISEGAEAGTLAVGYDIYEVDPWHYFIQIDNAGTTDRQWTPRLGLTNTNLTGRDDKFTAMVQGSPESEIEDNYSIYGRYEFPLWGPQLRIGIFGGRSEYEVDAGGGYDYLGHGSFYGGDLRFNALQHDGWFLDLTSSLVHEESKVTPFLAGIGIGDLGKSTTMNLWGVGIEAHRRDDISSTLLAVNRVQNLSGGSGQKDFWDSSALTGARNSSDQDFEILTFSANHSRFLDPDKVHRFLGTFKYIRPNARLIPARMTTFGGMYSVRGYEESRIVADGGLLASLQYEYDLVRRDQRDAGSEPRETKPWLRKLAPLAFVDFGRAKIKDGLPDDNKVQELLSIGTGFIIEIGEHFNGAVYYGLPLRLNDTTKDRDGRLNIGLMIRW